MKIIFIYGVGHDFFTNPKVSRADIERGYAKHPSITDYLPWLDYSDEHQVFLLEDQRSVAVALSIKPVACEARPVEQMQAIQQAISEALKNAIPLEKTDPWVVQVFVQRDNQLHGVMEQIKDSVQQHDTPNLTQAHLKTLQQHLDYLTQPEGVFFDQAVTNVTFRGGRLRVRLYLYRRLTEEPKTSAIDALLRTAQKLIQQLDACGVKASLMPGASVAADLIRWFNPRPKQTHGDVEALIQSIPFPTEADRPYGWDLADRVFFSAPESFDTGWLFDGLPHKVLTIQSLSQTPEIGHLTAERPCLLDDKVFVLIDHLPEHSILVMSIVFQALSETEAHLHKIARQCP